MFGSRLGMGYQQKNQNEPLENRGKERKGFERDGWNKSIYIKNGTGL